MATRSRSQRRKWRRPAPGQSPQEEQAQPPATPPAGSRTEEPTPAESTNPSNVIRKGIYLSALIYVEGEMPAPDDFIGPSTKALKSVLEAALKGEHEGLTMTLKKVEVQNDVEQDDAQDGGRGGEEKFQF